MRVGVGGVTADLTGVDILLHATSNIYTESQDE